MSVSYFKNKIGNGTFGISILSKELDGIKKTVRTLVSQQKHQDHHSDSSNYKCLEETERQMADLRSFGDFNQGVSATDGQLKNQPECDSSSDKECWSPTDDMEMRGNKENRKSSNKRRKRKHKRRW